MLSYIYLVTFNPIILNFQVSNKRQKEFILKEVELELLTVSHSATTDSLENVISTFHQDNMELVAERGEQLDQLEKLKRQVSNCTFVTVLYFSFNFYCFVVSLRLYSSLIFSLLSSTLFFSRVRFSSILPISLVISFSIHLYTILSYLLCFAHLLLYFFNCQYTCC